MSDPLIARLAELATAEPDPVRAERTRIRCRARLARGARARSTRATMPRVWQPLIAALGVVYLIEAIVQAVSVFSSKF